MLYSAVVKDKYDNNKVKFIKIKSIAEKATLFATCAAMDMQ